MFFLKHPLLSAVTGGKDTKVELSDLTEGDCSGQQPYLWASYLLLPGPPTPSHSDSRFSNYLLPWRKHKQRVLPTNHHLQAHKVRKSVRKSDTSTQDSRKERTTSVQKWLHHFALYSVTRIHHSGNTTQADLQNSLLNKINNLDT